MQEEVHRNLIGEKLGPIIHDLTLDAETLKTMFILLGELGCVLEGDPLEVIFVALLEVSPSPFPQCILIMFFYVSCLVSLCSPRSEVYEYSKIHRKSSTLILFLGFFISPNSTELIQK